MEIQGIVERKNAHKVVLNGNTYFFICDIPEMDAKIQLMKEKFKDDVFVNTLENEFLELDEYLYNVKEFHADFVNFLSEENMKKLIDKAPKKKDGGLAKGRLVDRIGCNNSVFIVTWADSWIYPAITAKSSGPDEITLTWGKHTETPREEK